jgi:serine/threonine protein kinase/Tol biopolymer transport system component
MGEVYRARDERLAREVAIKVLPPGVAADADRLRRFEQEARAAAALNHPGIVVVHDVGNQDGVAYLVTELLEGRTLRAALDSSALSPRRAIDYAGQIAAALAAAHDKGIVHRDLKPENIFVTTDHVVEILDFGLARLLQPEAAASGVSILATTPPGTEPGVVLGTVGYMAPEQVRGLPADHRSDIFALGATLYEMLSGTRAFGGDTAAETMTAILKSEPPDLESSGPRVAPALARIVARCLEKNPTARFQSTRDLAFALESARTSSGLATDQPRLAPVPGRPRVRLAREAVAWVIAVSALTALAYVAWPRSGSPVTPADVSQFAIGMPEGAQFQLGLATLALSPDGRHLAFIAIQPGQSVAQLWLRSMSSLVARPLAGTERPGAPFWSPDSRFIAFTGAADGRLKKVNINGGTPVPIAEVPNDQPWDGTWNDADIILLGGLAGAGLQKVHAGGGRLEPLTTLDAARGETIHRAPLFLPDGRHFLFMAQPPNVTYVASLDDLTPKRLLESDSKVEFSSGHLVFARASTLFAQPFDPVTLELSRNASILADGVIANAQSGRSSFSVAGSMLVVRPRDVPMSRLVWYSRSGGSLGTLGEVAAYRQVTLSPDEKHVATDRQNPDQPDADIWILDTVRGIGRRFTSHPAIEGDPVWSPDSTRIAFARQQRLVVKNVADGVEEALLTEETSQTFPEGWTPDGRAVVFLSNVRGLIGTTPVPGDGTFVPLVHDNFVKDEPHISPDGRWLLYQSAESGSTEVYVRPFPGPGAPIRISSSGGGQPRWRGDMQEIFYLTPDGRMMAVPLKRATNALEPGPAQQLFRVPFVPQLNIDQYAVTRNGDRFLVIEPIGNATPEPIRVVLNWPALLAK